MIECITGSNAASNADVLQQMFRHRYDVFVRRRGWSGLHQQHGLESDQFDTPSAVYLLSIDSNRAVDGGLRLIPTSKPHLLSDVFAHAVTGPVPRGPSIYEMTRYFTICRGEFRARQRRIAGELLCAMFEYCLAHGGEWITTMFDTFYVPRMRQNGWVYQLIGPPTPYDEGIAVAAKIAVSLQNLRSSQKVHGIAESLLRETSSKPYSDAA